MAHRSGGSDRNIARITPVAGTRKIESESRGGARVGPAAGTLKNESGARRLDWNRVARRSKRPGGGCKISNQKGGPCRRIGVEVCRRVGAAAIETASSRWRERENWCRNPGARARQTGTTRHVYRRSQDAGKSNKKPGARVRVRRRARTRLARAPARGKHEDRIKIGSAR